MMTPPPERSSSSSSAAHDAFDFDASLRFLDDLDASTELLPPPCDAEDVDTQRLLQELALQDQLPFSPDDLLPLSPKPEQQGQEQQGDAARSKTTTPPPAPRATKAVSSMTPVGSSSSSSSSSSTSTGRMRPKEEMELLRAQVEELEAELERIKQLQSKAEPERDVSQSRTEDAVWERIAERQQEAKRRAEIENVKLREMVEGQLRLVKSLEKLLRKRPNAAVRVCLGFFLLLPIGLLNWVYVCVNCMNANSVAGRRVVRCAAHWRPQTLARDNGGGRRSAVRVDPSSYRASTRRGRSTFPGVGTGPNRCRHGRRHSEGG
ncbi:hypothetical protein PINS_up022441 [Pythium insidiosum]|nr:hypothetical protein PINS_up022441 [Pythium insidiosum]